MNDISKTIKRMASLARLNFPEEELARYTAKAEMIISYIEKLNELDTSDVEPTSQTTHGIGDVPLRKDSVSKWPEPEKIIQAAPERDGVFIQVPKVIE